MHIASFVTALLLSFTALAQPRPLAIFVNGNNDCCAKNMGRTIDYLNSVDAEVIVTPYNALDPGGTQWTHAPNDALLLAELGARINDEPAGRPILLFGHSFGGDAILKTVGGGGSDIAPKVRADRRLLLLASLDPVATWGVRRTQSGYYHVPGNVDHFFNRWQRNTAPPFNFLDSGAIGSCDAADCNQAEQRNDRRADGSIIRGLFGRPLLLAHRDVPTDDYIQQQLIDTIGNALASRDIVTLKSDGYHQYLCAEGGGGGTVNANRVDARQWEHLEMVPTDGGQVLFVTYDGHYLSATDDGRITATAKTAGTRERFRVGVSGNGVWIATSYGDYVVVGANQEVRHQSSFPAYAWKWILTNE